MGTSQSNVQPRRGRPKIGLTNQQSEQHWPESTRLVFNGDKFLITLQSSTIHLLLTSTFSQVEALLILENAFPDMIEHDTMIKKAMHIVTKDLGSKFTKV